LIIQQLLTQHQVFCGGFKLSAIQEIVPAVTKNSNFKARLGVAHLEFQLLGRREVYLSPGTQN
jgi:hypothetical protein